MKGQLYKNPAWSLEYENNLLIFHGGADSLFAIEDIPLKIAGEILEEWRHKAHIFRLERLTAAAQTACQQLITADVLRPNNRTQKQGKVAIIWFGIPNQLIQQALTDSLNDFVFVETNNQADWLLCIRTTATWHELLEIDYHIPHLFVDCAYMHTISLGPAVYPSYTSTISDLAGRLIYSWGDAEPPHQPHIQYSPHIIAELAAIELRHMHDKNSRLINKTVSYNFKAHTVHEEAVYKNPQALHNKHKQESSGYVELW